MAYSALQALQEGLSGWELEEQAVWELARELQFLQVQQEVVPVLSWGC